MKDFEFNNKEYTLVDTYYENNGKIVQLNSDDNILLFCLEEDETLRELTEEEDKVIREKYNLIDHGYVTLTAKDIYNLELKSKSIDSNLESKYKEYFKKALDNIDYALQESPYINNRINKMRYRCNGRGNAYLKDRVYFFGDHPLKPNDWVTIHETIHGIVDKSKLTTYGLIEGITDMFTGQMLPKGNYSQNKLLYGGEIQVNESGKGQNHLIPFAKQLCYALGPEYNAYEMFTKPHNQIDIFAKMYGKSNCRTLNHKINSLYYNNDINVFRETQDYMLKMIFDKKFESVINEETAISYFNELVNFGLLRGRINGKDEDLEKYYTNQLNKLKEKGINYNSIPKYREKPFYPNGDVYLRYGSFIKNSIKAKSEGKGEHFQILYNKDKTCVYIVIDGVLSLVQNDSIENKRRFISNEIDNSNSNIIQQENGIYLISAPDGVVEEAYETNASEIIDNYFQKTPSKSR